VWRPAEADVSIRPGWFHHPSEDARVLTADQLVDLYCTSVGRNSKLLLNVPPTRDGVLHDIDVARLAGFHDRLRVVFAEDVAIGRRVTWTRTPGGIIGDLDLGQARTVSSVRLEENITRGQSISSFVVSGRVDGSWQELARGTTVG
jgi:alpha-L-fucosidase